MEGLDSVEVAPAKLEGDGESNYAAEEQLWRHEFFRDCMAPKQANFKVNAYSWLLRAAPPAKIIADIIGCSHHQASELPAVKTVSRWCAQV